MIEGVELQQPLFGQCTREEVFALAETHAEGEAGWTRDAIGGLESMLDALMAHPSPARTRELIQLANQLKCVIAERLRTVGTGYRPDGQMDFSELLGEAWQPWLHACSMLSDFQELLDIHANHDTGWVQLHRMAAAIRAFVHGWIGTAALELTAPAHPAAAFVPERPLSEQRTPCET